MNLRWYPGTVSFTQKLKVTDPAKFKAEGEVEFMACNDETCLPRIKYLSLSIRKVSM